MLRWCMYRKGLQRQNFKSTVIHYGNGPTREKSAISRHRVVNDCTMLMNLKPDRYAPPQMTPPSNRAVTATAEFPPQTNGTICKDKLPTWKRNFQGMSSSPTSLPGSTSSGRDFKPFWNSLSKDWSARLPLPTATDCVASALTCLNGYSVAIPSQSWFSINQVAVPKTNSPQISFPSSTFSPVKSTAGGSTQRNVNKEKMNLSCKRIRLYPSTRDRRTILQWFHAARKTYNLALETIKKGKIPPTDFERLRWRWVTDRQLGNQHKFLASTPSKIRAGAIRDLCDAYETNFAKRKTNPEHTFDIRFRRRKGPQSISIQKDSFVKRPSPSGPFMFPRSLHDPLDISPHVDHADLVKYDCRLILTVTGDIFLSVPSTVETALPSDTTDVAALDPGVRTFFTAYSPQQGVLEIGKNDIGRITRLCCRLDGLMGKRDTTTSYHKRRRMDKAAHRIRRRIKNLITDCHHRTVNFLLSRFQSVVISPFEVSNLVTRRGRKISRSSVRKLLCWSHYAFRQRLITKAKQVGRNVVVNSEEYTTQTCCNCGNLTQVGKAKIYRCSSCGMVADRDANAAACALIKLLTERGVPPPCAAP